MSVKTFKTKGGLTLIRNKQTIPIDTALDNFYNHIDHTKGCLFAGDYEYPGRYSRWDIALLDPPLEMVSRQRHFSLNALNERGSVILQMLAPAVTQNPHVESHQSSANSLSGIVKPMPADFPEEQRSKQPSIFSIFRALTDLLACDDEYLSFFGAFGYDLVFQFEPIKLKHDRSDSAPDCHLFLPDRLRAIDHQKETAFELTYDFENAEGLSTAVIARSEQSERRGNLNPPPTKTPPQIQCDHKENEFAQKVETIRQGCQKGDFFEVVLSQEFTVACTDPPSEIFKRLRKENPSPYQFIINFGDEQLIGASPEMFVRVNGKTVETCPISGTVRRGDNPMDDAKQILNLLNSKKDESELTMCTDVDRNDKSRVCVPGSVRLIDRRLVETYSKLFHTVDHVKGRLLDECDIFDAFLSHMWACTLTGSPKPIAMQTIENLENSPRRWYGGCVGFFNFKNQLNTGITIRTIHLQNQIASVRAGATLLFDSVPDDEETETRVKAAAFLNAVTQKSEQKQAPFKPATTKSKKRILFVDNQDSFVHTLANYVRQTHADVITLRAGFDPEKIDQIKPHLVFISPGPGTPDQLGVPQLVAQVLKRNIPIFGVCLGHQGIAQHFGAKLGVLSTPMHGKDSPISHDQTGIFKDIPNPFVAGRYHSLYVVPESLPDCLTVTARTDNGLIMAIQHNSLPVAAVQFHPESILTLHNDIGLKIIKNAINLLT